MEAADFYLRSIKIAPGSTLRPPPVDKVNGSQSDTLRAGVTDASTDSFYRAKLREGFVDLRNSYHQRLSQRQQTSNWTSNSVQQTAKPNYERSTERPVSIHGSSSLGQYPKKEYDYGTLSSRASVDSLATDSVNQPLIRSTSNVHLDGVLHTEPLLKKDYGSADLLEMKKMAYQSGDADFFTMLQSYRTEDKDQRAPAPPGIDKVLRGVTEIATPSSSASTKYSQPQNTPPAPSYMQQTFGSSPPVQQSPLTAAQLQSGDQRRNPRSSKKVRPRSGDITSLIRKLRPTKSDGESAVGLFNDASSDSHSLLSDLGLVPEERLRKKAFVHYDCQSIGINIIEAAERRRSIQLGNTKTGASAASNLDEQGVEGEVYDVPYNPLVTACAAFRNEVGGEEERNVALTRITAQRKVQQLLGGATSCDYTRQIKPPVCSGLSVLDGSLLGQGHRFEALEKHHAYILEYRDRGCIYYRQHFRYSEHQNYFGNDEKIGPVAISIKREKITCNNSLVDSKEGASFLYRVIVRTSELSVLRGMIHEDALPTASRLSNNSRGLPAKDIIEYIAPEIQIGCLRQAIGDDKTKDQLLMLDEQSRSDAYKVGIMYCQAGQTTEEEMYNNEHGSPAFTEFLDLIAHRVKLQGFEKYKGGLDNKTDTTGTHSYYTTCQNYEIMFHVSTLLPFMHNNTQQLMRKRHIGNDIVTIVFQEPGSEPFSVKSVRSHFQHVFVIVRVANPNSDQTRYSVAITHSKDVPSFGPPIPENAVFAKSQEFAQFLIAKIVNAENASHQSEKFQAMAVRTRREYMKELANNCVTSHSLDSNSKLGKFSLSVGSGKKKEKRSLRMIPDVFTRGAIVWPAQLEDFGQSALVDVYVAISAELFAVIEIDSLEPIFACWCSSVIGWTINQSGDGSGPGIGLRAYYNHGECVVVKPLDMDDLHEITDRLRVVSRGCETQEMILRRNESGQLGFHVHYEGVISDVTPQGYAWNAGLRTGSRLVEICKVATATLSHEQMIDLLRTSTTVRVIVVPPLDEGRQRKGHDERTNDYYLLYPTEDQRCKRDGEETSAYYSDDDAQHGVVLPAAKYVTLRSNSSGGSSSSPMSTLSGRHERPSARNPMPESDAQPSRHTEPDRLSPTVYDGRPLRENAQSTAPYDDRPGHDPTPVYAVYNYDKDTHSSEEMLSDSRRAGQKPRSNATKRAEGQNSSSSRRSSSPPAPPSHHHMGGYKAPPSHTAHASLDRSSEQEIPAQLARAQEMLAYTPQNHRVNKPGQEAYHSQRTRDVSYKIQRTFSDESLNAYRRKRSPASSLANSDRRRGSHDDKAPHQGAAYENGQSELEDLDWNKLVFKATKAIEGSSHYATLVSWQQSVTSSHDALPAMARDPVSHSGHSTPTTSLPEDQIRELKMRCARLDNDLHMERMRSRDLQMKLVTEKNRGDESSHELARLRSENDNLRKDLEYTRAQLKHFTQNFFGVYSGPESAT